MKTYHIGKMLVAKVGKDESGIFYSELYFGNVGKRELHDTVSDATQEALAHVTYLKGLN